MKMVTIYQAFIAGFCVYVNTGNKATDFDLGLQLSIIYKYTYGRLTQIHKIW
jgi:hypothetical protein